ncbi:alpha/beta hydrolase [TM7 phylum sp. oral taxon 351]|nr:alpha/beta hydrolase [TM7 phylum sp. oral taxon 351]
MVIYDLYPEKSKVMLLIHPMLASSESMRTFLVENILKVTDDYRYIIPDLSGHGEAMSETYVSATEEARILTQYLLGHGVSEVDLGFAASLGGVVLFEILNRREIKFKRLFFEGVSFCENAKLGGFLMTKIMLAKQKKGSKNPKLAVEKMSKMFGGQAGRVMAERFLKMDPLSIKNIVRDCSNVGLPKMDTKTQRNCIFSYGEKDSDLRLAKRKIPKKYPEAKLVVDERYGHCERIVKDAEGYVKGVIGVD